MGKVPKVTLMIQCKVDGIWKKLSAPFQENPGTILDFCGGNGGSAGFQRVGHRVLTLGAFVCSGPIFEKHFDKLFTFSRGDLNVLLVLAEVRFIEKSSTRGAVVKEGAIVKPVALPGSDGEHELQEKCNTTPRAHAFYRHQVLDYLNPSMQAFVTKQEMMFVGTADRHGEADTSFRAGLAGFIRVLDQKTLAYPEYRGNGVMSSLGNISENPHVGLLFVDFTDRIGLHVNGRARIVENDEFPRVASASEPVGEDIRPATGRAPERWVVVSVLEAYIHCSKHIPRMQKINEEIQWGTDDMRLKGGDYFKAKNSPRE